MSYVITAAVITHAIPGVWAWGWWGVSTAWKSAYWLCYGRYAEAKKHEALIQRIKNELKMEYRLELSPGGTDVILVQKNS